MADIQETGSGYGRSLKKKPQVKKQSVRVDMTPMVDLGFLLITFFMLTMVLNEFKSINYIKPIDGPVKEPVSECQVLNLLIDSNERVFAYNGLNTEAITVSSFKGSNSVRHVVMNTARKVKAECGNYKSGKPREIICLIKLLPGAKYKSMVEVLDEMIITETSTYAIQDPLPEELKAIEEQSRQLAVVVNKKEN